MPSLDQCFSGGRADITRAACNQYVHLNLLKYIVWKLYLTDIAIYVVAGSFTAKQPPVNWEIAHRTGRVARRKGSNQSLLDTRLKPPSSAAFCE
jgi:hypothetical protein